MTCCVSSETWNPAHSLQWLLSADHCVYLVEAASPSKCQETAHAACRRDRRGSASSGNCHCLFSSAGSVSSNKLFKCCLCVWVCESVWMLTRVEQIAAAEQRDLWSCIIYHRRTHEPWLHMKTRSVWPTSRVKIVCQKKWAWIGIFKPAEAHSPWDACFSISPSFCHHVQCQAG